MQTRTWVVQRKGADNKPINQPNAVVTIYESGTTTLATGIEQGNPVIADANGVAIITAPGPESGASGLYDFVAQPVDGSAQIRIDAVQFADTIELTAQAKSNADRTAADRMQTSNDVLAAAASANAAQFAAGSAQSSARVAATWAQLSLWTPSQIGEGAEVLDTDTGMHADPLTSETVSNAGRYQSYELAAGAWKWISMTGLAQKADKQDVDEIKETFRSAAPGDIYFGIADEFGAVGDRLHARSSDNSVGTAKNRVSDVGVATASLDLQHTTTGRDFVAKDRFGCAIAPVIDMPEGITTAALQPNVETLTGLVDHWIFAARKDALLGLASKTALTSIGAALSANSAEVKYAGYLQSSFAEAKDYTISIVLQLPAIPVESTTARIAVWSYQSSSALGCKLALQRRADGRFAFYRIKNEANGMFDGFVLSSDYQPGDWLSLQYTQKNSGASGNYSIIHCRGQVQTRSELDAPIYTLSGQPLLLGRSFASDSSWARPVRIAELVVIGAALSASDVAALNARSRARMSMLSIAVK